MIVGGTGRNSGKTTLRENLLEKFGSPELLTVVKISNLKPENRSFHGHEVMRPSEKDLMQKEFRTYGNKAFVQ